MKEYKHIIFTRFDVTARLNLWAAQGWELHTFRDALEGVYPSAIMVRDLPQVINTSRQEPGLGKD